MSENDNQTKIKLNSKDGSSIILSASKEDAEKLKETLSNIEQVQAANRQLTEENQQLTADLTLFAEKELSKRVKQYGIDEDLPEETKILKVKRAEEQQYQQPQGIAPLNDAQTGETSQPRKQSSEGYDTIEDMFLDIQRKTKSSDPATKAEYQAVQKEFAKKALKKPLNVELESNMRTIARRPRMLENEDSEKFAMRLDNWKKSIKFKQIKEDE